MQAVRALLSAVMMSALFAASSDAQVEQLRDLGSRIAKEIRPLNPRLVAVVDFRSADDKVSAQGHYLAWVLSAILQDQEKKKVVVAEHTAFDADLARLKIAPIALIPGDSLRAVSPHICAEVLVTGMLTKLADNQYSLEIVPVRVASGEPLPTIAAKITTTGFFESFWTPVPADVPVLTGKASEAAGISMPSCVYCPDPQYSDLARREKIQGSNVFNVLISSDGRAAQIWPVRFLGYGLDEQGFNAIRQWKFRPATRKKDNTPVAAIVPVEVTFRLF